MVIDHIFLSSEYCLLFIALSFTFITRVFIYHSMVNTFLLLLEYWMPRFWCYCLMWKMNLCFYESFLCFRSTNQKHFENFTYFWIMFAASSMVKWYFMKSFHNLNFVNNEALIGCSWLFLNLNVSWNLGLSFYCMQNLKKISNQISVWILHLYLSLN